MKNSAPSDRRSLQRDALISCAEHAIAQDGLTALRARNLAACAGCSVGAVYNLVADLDELVLLVAQRTMIALNARLDEVAPSGAAAVDDLVAWALAYCAFAVDHRNRWRALFEFRLAAGRSLPEWFEADRMRLFARLESALASRLPGADASTLRLRARTLFSTVHGIVALGLEEKIDSVAVGAVEAELDTFVRTYLAGFKRSSS